MLCYHDYPCSDPQCPCKKLGVVGYAYNPSTGGRDRRFFRDYWLASLTELASLGFNERPWFKTKVTSDKVRHSKFTNCWPLPTPAQVCERMRAQTHRQKQALFVLAVKCSDPIKPQW